MRAGDRFDQQIDPLADPEQRVAVTREHGLGAGIAPQ
jgi:hypothetical protein